MRASASEIDLNRTGSAEQDCSGAFAQNRSAACLAGSFYWRGVSQQAPFLIGIAEQPVCFFGSHDKAVIQVGIGHYILSHLYRHQSDGAVAYQSISGTIQPEDCREM